MQEDVQLGEDTSSRMLGAAGPVATSVFLSLHWLYRQEIKDETSVSE